MSGWAKVLMVRLYQAATNVVNPATHTPIVQTAGVISCLFSVRNVLQNTTVAVPRNVPIRSSTEIQGQKQLLVTAGNTGKVWR
jgi:hypothetical protein